MDTPSTTQLEAYRVHLRAQAAGYEGVARIRDEELARSRDIGADASIAPFDGVLEGMRQSRLVNQAMDTDARSDAPRLRAALDRCLGIERAAPTDEEWA
jgi:hypothetical protein